MEYLEVAVYHNKRISNFLIPSSVYLTLVELTIYLIFDRLYTVPNFEQSQILSDYLNQCLYSSPTYPQAILQDLK